MIAIFSIIYIIIVLLTFLKGVECYLRRQLVKANFYFSVGTFALLALIVLIILVVL